jgi:hypothetical protein
MFSDKFLSKNGAMFHVDDLHVLTKIQSFLEKYFLKSQMKWILINSVQQISNNDHLLKVFIFLCAHFYFISFFSFSYGNT